MYHTEHLSARMAVRCRPARDSDGTTARERLLAAAMEYVAEHGVGDLSLRGLAAALGTSHRMLSYHFGSREGLLIEVIRDGRGPAARRRSRRCCSTRTRRPPRSCAARGSASRTRRCGRTSACSSRSTRRPSQGHPHALPLLDGIVDLWVEPLTRIAVAQGRDEAEARAEARLGVAVTRGLLLDLLATGRPRGRRRRHGALHRGDGPGRGARAHPGAPPRLDAASALPSVAGP